MTISRRHFLKAGTALGAGLAAGLPLAANAAAVSELVILHTNDVHSRMDPFPADGRQYGGQGGVVPRAALIKHLRQRHPHLLLLDAGDMVQGTPYFNFFKGEAEIKAMNAMGYDCATLGNHDFDNGLDGLKQLLEWAQFPVVSANYDFSKTHLAGMVKPYRIIKRGGRRIGIFGMGVGFEGLVAPHHHGATRYLDPVPVAREMVQQLRKEKVDMIICLSHLGYEYPSDKISDRRLAAQVEGIDLIIGGHTHTFLPEPVTVNDPAGRPVLINQVGWSGLFLGQLTASWQGQNQLSWNGTSLPVTT